MTVRLELDPNAALVLFELLASQDDIPERLKLEAAERNALWALEGALEKVLAAPFAPDYSSQLAAARASLVEKGGS
jgi:hypothetical protein